MDKTIYSVRELLDKLHSEHSENCYYRGQTKCYNYPLWPSMYRGAVIGHYFNINPRMKSRCNRGENYVYRSRFLSHPMYLDPQNIAKREKLRAAMCEIRNALGYCVAEAMFQQAGWSSEGLDVTGDLNIALFFATHILNGKRYYIDDSESIHVIYRWRIPKENWSIERIKHTNFNNAPLLFPTNDVIKLFGECDTFEEFQKSVIEYRKAIGWGTEFDAYKIRDCRPFEIIKFPRNWKKKSRIVKQSASLLFPDSISWDEFSKYKYVNVETDIYDGYGFFLEDLSMTPNCDIYFFKITDEDTSILDFESDSIYIEDDLSHRFLNGWLQSSGGFDCGYGGIPMIFTPYYISELRYRYSETWYPDSEKEFHG